MTTLESVYGIWGKTTYKMNLVHMNDVQLNIYILYIYVLYHICIYIYVRILYVNIFLYIYIYIIYRYVCARPHLRTMDSPRKFKLAAALMYSQMKNMKGKEVGGVGKR